MGAMEHIEEMLTQTLEALRIDGGGELLLNQEGIYGVLDVWAALDRSDAVQRMPGLVYTLSTVAPEDGDWSLTVGRCLPGGKFLMTDVDMPNYRAPVQEYVREVVTGLVDAYDITGAYATTNPDTVSKESHE